MAKNKTTSITVKANLDTTNFDSKIKILEASIAKAQTKLQRLAKTNVAGISSKADATSLVSSSSARLDQVSARAKQAITSSTLRQQKAINEEYAKQLSSLREKNAFTGSGKEIERQIRATEAKLQKERDRELAILQKNNAKSLAYVDKTVAGRKNSISNEATKLVTLGGSLGDVQKGAQRARNIQIVDDNIRRGEEAKKQLKADNAARLQQAIQRNSSISEARSKVMYGTGSGLSTASTLVAGYLGGNLVEKIGAYKQLEARVRNVSLSAEEATKNMANLQAISIGSGQNFASTANMFSKITEAVRSNSGTTQDATDVVQAFQMSLRASGTSAEQASAAAYQFSQSLSSGVFRGDEFTSVNEGNPLFTRALAKSMGVTVGELKDLSQKGALTTTRVVAASKTAKDSLTSQALSVPLTVGQNTTNTIDKLVIAFNTLDKQYGVLDKLSKVIIAIGDNASTVIPVLTLLGGLVGLSVLGKAVGALKDGLDLLKGASRTKTIIDATTVGANVVGGVVGGSAGRATGTVAGNVAGGAAGGVLARFLPTIMAALPIISIATAAVAAVAGLAWYRSSSAQDKRDARSTSLDDISKQLNDYETAKTGTNFQQISSSKETIRQTLIQRIKEEDIAIRDPRNNGDSAAESLIRRNDFAKKLKDLEDDSFSRSKKGEYIKARANLGLELNKQAGGLTIGKDAYDQITGFPLIIQEFKDKVFSASGETQVSLGELTLATASFIDTLKTDSEVGSGILMLIEQLGHTTGSAADIISRGIGKLSLKQEQVVNARVNDSISVFTKRLETLDSVRKSIESSSKSSSLMSLMLSNSGKDLSLYKSGLPSESNTAKYYSNIFNIETKSNKKILEQNLNDIEITRKAKLDAQKIDLSTKIAAIQTEDSKRLAFEQNRIKDLNNGSKESKLALAGGALESLPDFMSNSEKMNDNKLQTEAATANARKALFQESATAIQQIDIVAMRERQALLTQYVADVDTSIKTTLDSYQRYSKQLVDMDRESTQKRMDLRKSLRAVELDKKIAEDNLEYAKKKSLIRKNAGDTLDPRFTSNIAIDFAKKEQDSLLQQIALTTDLVEKQRLLNEYRSESQSLLSTRESSIGATSNSDIEKQKALLAAKESYAQDLQKAFDLQSQIDSTQRSDIESALGTTKSVLDSSVADRGAKSSELTGLNKLLLGSAQDDFNKVNLVPSSTSIEALKKSIQDELDKNEFTIRFNANPYQSYTSPTQDAPATSTVNIYLPNGDKLEAQMTQQQISDANKLSNIANRT